MDIRTLSKGLEFQGRVKGRRQTYYVFSGAGAFFVFSFSRSKPKAGYFNAVGFEAVRYAWRLVRGRKGVTAQDLFRRSRRPRLIGSALEALNILYVMVAAGKAHIDRRHTARQLFFNAGP